MRPLALLLACVSYGAAGCTDAAARGRGHRWLPVAHDASYDIYMDTSRITTYHYHTYIVWYRTDHAVTHLYKGEPFNREIVQSILRCGDLAFKVASVDMSLGASRPISQQRADLDELGQQPWRHVERGTIEAVAARMSCDFARQHSTGGR